MRDGWHVDSASQHRPTRVQVAFVVFIVPDAAAAIANISGDGGMAVFRFAVSTLDQFGMTGCASPVLLNTCTRFAQDTRGVGIHKGDGLGPVSESEDCRLPGPSRCHFRLILNA
jgi:hypothetical protein